MAYVDEPSRDCCDELAPRPVALHRPLRNRGLAGRHPRRAHRRRLDAALLGGAHDDVPAPVALAAPCRVRRRAGRLDPLHMDRLGRGDSDDDPRAPTPQGACAVCRRRVLRAASHGVRAVLGGGVVVDNRSIWHALVVLEDVLCRPILSWQLGGQGTRSGLHFELCSVATGRRNKPRWSVHMLSSSRLDIIPSDIFDHIFDIVRLDDSNKRTLFAASRTCKAWAKLTLRARFHTVSLAVRVSGESHTSFFLQDFVEESARAQCVRALILRWGEHPDRSEIDFEDIFQTYLPLFRELRTLELRGVLYKCPQVRPAFPIRNLRKLVICGQAYSFRSQYSHDQRALCELIWLFPDLLKLELHEVLLWSHGPPFASPLPTSALHDVSSRSSQIHSFTLDIANQQPALIHACAASLEHLRYKLFDASSLTLPLDIPPVAGISCLGASAKPCYHRNVQEHSHYVARTSLAMFRAMVITFVHACDASLSPRESPRP